MAMRLRAIPARGRRHPRTFPSAYVGRVEDATDSSDVNQVVREILQAAASLPLGDWFEYTIGSPMMDITAAPYGGARYPVEVRMGGRIFAKFHLDAGIGDIVIHPVET